MPSPGHPWDAAALLGAMRASTRPGGVPADVETLAIAAMIADTIWTMDGSAWDTSTVGGHCESSRCILDIAGAHANRAGEDLWTLEIDLSRGRIVPVIADVRSIPREIIQSLDRLARDLTDQGSLDSMTLTTARWLPPPVEAGQFVVSYRSGGEEGSCQRELTLDAVRGDVIEERATGC